MLNVPRETVGSIIRKLKIKTKVQTQPGRTKKRRKYWLLQQDSCEDKWKKMFELMQTTY